MPASQPRPPARVSRIMFATPNQASRLRRWWRGYDARAIDGAPVARDDARLSDGAIPADAGLKPPSRRDGSIPLVPPAIRPALATRTLATATLARTRRWLAVCPSSKPGLPRFATAFRRQTTGSGTARRLTAGCHPRGHHGRPIDGREFVHCCVGAVSPVSSADSLCGRLPVSACSAGREGVPSRRPQACPQISNRYHQH
jgi:hypothetical protein